MNNDLQVLIVTMNQKNYQLLDKMNIQSDALVGNQTDENNVEEFEYKSNKVRWFSFNERGVGLNRNNLLMRATSDIILFADDDVVYDDGYKDKVLEAFKKHPEAQMILFNVIPMPRTINPYLITKYKRIRWYNCLKYGAVRIAVRLSALRESNVYYSLLFGGGAKYYSGEDSLFLMDCIKKGMKVYAYPETIGKVYFGSSSWFEGFNDKYFKDKGTFFYFLSKRFSKLLCLQYCIRCKRNFINHCSPKQAYKLMIEGIKEFKKGN